MILEETAFESLNGIYINPKDQSKRDKISQDTVYTFMLELVNMNYILDKPVIDELCKLSADKGGKFLKQQLLMVKKHLGAHVKHEPFYPNFPQQVMDASHLELFIYAITHYFSCGNWKPVFIKEKRVEINEKNPVVNLHLVSLDELKEYFVKLVNSKTGIPVKHDAFIVDGVRRNWIKTYQSTYSEIPFRETSCKLAVECLKQGKDIGYFVKTTTDVLRIMAVYSNQKPDLTKVVKFTSMKRKERRVLIQLLEKVINIEDVKRHTTIWIRAFHCLHVGEYGGKVNEIATRFRSEKNVPTKNTPLCKAIENKDTDSAIRILKNLPSMFARCLDKLLRDSPDDKKILSEFSMIAVGVESKVLLQALGHFKGSNKIEKRSVFAKSNLMMFERKENQSELTTETANMVIDTLRQALVEKYKALNHFNENSKVYITKEAEGILLPMQIYTGSDSNKRAIARGSRLMTDECDMDKNVIRFFVHWIGKIVDLGAVFIKEDMETTKFINYTHLKEEFAVHSGDIINAPAPKGASEFIDIYINQALKSGYRYVEMNVRSYSGPKFSQLQQCFAGYMMRKEQQAGEIFEPSTVKVKMDLTCEATDINPFMFDLKTREMIWLDIPSHPKVFWLNDLNRNINQTKEILKACLDLPLIKVNMKELLELHVEAGSATIVENREDSNFVVGLGEGDLDLYDFATINSKWI
ncbi:uncharacterized protein SPAPADRAFT_58847 [Spathaspora passalidarum NRRL Y-27907]|uniref:Uncharacterized protein n=1 Tax=Spathaspora passalidarum (strain NRRL Y-27907 / 11-Y1) TaxID=619300 RepID=G3AEA4_SPAPN|nr:uncharacterized protein SPAPADRAFT_58847 [Spathaspora passalidarum NRRL Y-27907]EGW35638.1 hypothetical protein SPAPADRAFT_58847 [Spathaspora passalidarum NRRL Y-27907]